MSTSKNFKVKKNLIIIDNKSGKYNKNNFLLTRELMQMSKSDEELRETKNFGRKNILLKK